ncbi:hypothetical protein [Mesorhizobium australafricanum]|nr:hypothetical protein [Mesorhizobium sp. VK3E]
MADELQQWRALAEREVKADPDTLTWRTPFLYLAGWPADLSCGPVDPDDANR